MPENVQRFVIVAPTDMDGTPYEVAERAVRQAAAVAGILKSMLGGARGMVLNAEMERQLYFDHAADFGAAEAGAQNKRISVLIRELDSIEGRLNGLATAAKFDPKHPPKDDD